MVLRGLFFPRTLYGEAWFFEARNDDVPTLGEYPWAKAVWQFLTQSLDEFQLKLVGPMSEV